MGGQPPTPAERQGSCGLIDTLPYLRQPRGHNPLELFAGDGLPDPQDLHPRRHNYWGYSPLSWMVPIRANLVRERPLEARSRCAPSSTACHQAGWRCCWMWSLQPPSGSCNQNGPPVSWAKAFCRRPLLPAERVERVQDVTVAQHDRGNRPHVAAFCHSSRCAAGALELGIDWLSASSWHRPLRGENFAAARIKPPCSRRSKPIRSSATLKLVE